MMTEGSVGLNTTPDTIFARRILGELPSGLVPEPAARTIAGAYGLRVPPSIFVPVHDELPPDLPFAGPYVVKMVSTRVAHKTEVGGVRVGLRDRVEVTSAMSDIADRLGHDADVLDGFLIDEFVPADHELLVGGRIDPVFGPIITFGIGGLLVELLDDVSIRLCPIVERDVVAMLSELRGRKLISGLRGRPAVHLESVVESVLAIGGEQGLLVDCADLLVELDVNPLRVDASCAVAVDVRLVRS